MVSLQRHRIRSLGQKFALNERDEVHLKVLTRELGLLDKVLVGVRVSIVEESEQNHLVGATLELVMLSVVKVSS